MREVTRFTTLTKRLASILKVSEATDREWVFRGVADADHGLHSSLSRWVKKKKEQPASPNYPTESEVEGYERRLIEEARRWYLDRHVSGPLTGLELLAALQHTGTPTRLIDVSHEALVAAWFAVEKHGQKDGRVFAIEVSKRAVEDAWVRQPDPFWWQQQGSESSPVSNWCSDFWLWTPPPVEKRMVLQHGAFLLGGVPTGQPQLWYLRGQAKTGRFGKNEVARLTSIAARVHSVGGKGRPADRPMRTFRIKASAKAELRWQLEVLLDLSDRTLFPDFAHFASLASEHRLLS